jgi:hypothetical protein
LTHCNDVIAAGHNRHFLPGRRTLMDERRVIHFIFEIVLVALYTYFGQDIAGNDHNENLNAQIKTFCMSFFRLYTLFTQS